MKNEMKGLREYSEEVEMLMGQTPNWIFRWGITVVSVILVALLTGAWFIRWPDTMTVRGMLCITGPDTVWYMRAELAPEEMRKLHGGMAAHVTLNNRDEEWGYYPALVDELPLHPDSTNRFPLVIRLTDNTTQAGRLEQEYQNIERRKSPWTLEATAIIYLTEHRLLERLFSK